MIKKKGNKKNKKDNLRRIYLRYSKKRLYIKKITIVYNMRLVKKRNNKQNIFKKLI